MTDEQYLVYVLTKYVPIDPKPEEGAWISEFDTAISNIEKIKQIAYDQGKKEAIDKMKKDISFMYEDWDY